MLLIDTSSSVFNAFDDELQLAQDLVNSLDTNVFDEAVHIGLLQFSNDATVILPLERGHEREEVVDRINRIKFTGKSTRIADAVDRGLNELIAKKREDATQMFILISDGHGQEYWDRVVVTGEKLQTSGVEIFAATTSGDYNYQELLIYTGDENRIFVGATYKDFVPYISKYINTCILNGTTENGTKTEHSLKNKPENSEKQDLISKNALNENKPINKNEKTDLNNSIEKFEEKKNIAEPSDAKKSEELSSHKKDRLNEKEDKETENIVIATEFPILEKSKENLTEVSSSEIDSLDPHGPVKEPAKSTIKQVHEVLKLDGNKTENINVKKNSDTEETNISEKLNDATLAENNTSSLETATRKIVEENLSDHTTITALLETPKKEPLIEIRNNTKDATVEITKQFTENFNSSENTQPSTILSTKSIKRLSETQSLETTTVLTNTDLTKTNIPEQTTEILNTIENFINTSTVVTPNIKEMVHEAIQKAEIIEKFLSQQKIVSETIPCQTDIIFIIDRSQKPTFVYEHQIQLIKDLVLKTMPEEVESNKIRLSTKPHLLVPLNGNQTRNGFLQDLEQVTPSEEKSSLSQAIRRAVIEIMLNRRPSARLVTILVTDGINNDIPSDLEKSINDLTIFPKSESYVVSLNPEYNFSVLQALTGNKWKVYVDARVRKFVNEVFHSLKECEIPSEEAKSKVFIEDGEHEPTSEVEKVEHLQIAGKAVEIAIGNCNHDPLDIVIVLDVSTSVSDDFDEQKLVAMHLLKQAPESDYVQRIRIGLITFSSGAQLAIPLNSPRTRDDLLYAFDRIEHSGGQTSVVSGLNLAINEIHVHHRPNARLVIILLSDGNSRDEWNRVVQAGSDLDLIARERYAITLSPDSNERELTVYAGDGQRVFNQNTVQRFLFDSRLFFTCPSKNSTENVKKLDGTQEILAKEQEDRQIELTNDKITIKKEEILTNETISEKFLEKMHEEAKMKIRNGTEKRVADQPFHDSTEKLNEKVVESKMSKHFQLPEHSIGTISPIVDIQSPKFAFLSDKCKVDLMFIIDTSQSVHEEFQKQLQFATDLVKRLPNEDFETRVQVAAVSFNSRARLEFPFGKLVIKEDVLETLSKLKHSGGSTSAASGVALAVEEMQRARRSDARLMVVLISDGNSQDYWDRVIFEANRLREIKADVYAPTITITKIASTKLLEKQTTLTVSKTTLSTTVKTILSTNPPDCQHDIIDLFFILDTSTSVEKEFFAEKNFALDLIKVLPDADFKTRIRVGLSKFHGTAKLQFGFLEESSKDDILYDIERVEHTGGQTSLVLGTEIALEEIKKNRRPNSRLVTIIISDGNSQDDWNTIQRTAKKLRETGSEIYAVTLSEKYYFDELKAYTGNEQHIYVDESVEKFIQEVGQSVASCPGKWVDHVTMAPFVQASATPTTK